PPQVSWRSLPSRAQIPFGATHGKTGDEPVGATVPAVMARFFDCCAAVRGQSPADRTGKILVQRSDACRSAVDSAPIHADDICRPPDRVSGDRKPAGEGLDIHQPERVRTTRKDKNVGGRID